MPATEPETIRIRAEELCAKLPEDGSQITNERARQRVGDWAQRTDEEYWEVRDYLVDAGRVRKGKGRGGTIALVLQSAPVVEVKETVVADNHPFGAVGPGPSLPEVIREEATVAASASRREAELYEPIKQALHLGWTKDQRLSDALIEITAAQGSRRTGGTWTRPDIVLVAVRTYRHLPGKYIDVVTFEVKAEPDIRGVFEAAAHSRTATRAYLVFPAGRDGDGATQFDPRIVQECRRFNVGLIVFDDAANYNTWETVWEPERREPSPEALDEFLAVQLSDAIRDVLRERVR